MPRNIFWKKGLAVGIIVLFIGIGVQPVFAKDTIKTTSKTLEDCGCQTVNNHNLNSLIELSNRIERLLSRVEIFTNFISILYKNNPEISEKCEEISSSITTLKEINKELKLDSSFTDHLIICIVLETILIPLELVEDSIRNLIHKYEDTNPNLAVLIDYFILTPVIFIWSIIYEQAYYLDCYWYP